MRRYKVKIIFLLALLLSVFLNIHSVFAINFQINKAKVSIKLPPGWSDGGTVRVTNRDASPVHIRAYVQDWIYDTKDGSKIFSSPNTTFRSCADWIKFYPAEFTIPAKSSQEVSFVVGIPPNAVGGYYAVLFFEAGGGEIMDKAKGVMAKVYHRIASLFFVEAEGTISRKAQISNFKISSLADSYGLKITVENKGNVALASKGGYDIINDEGFVFTRGDFGTIYLMPNDVTEVSANIPKNELGIGSYDLVLTFDLEGDVLVKEYDLEIKPSRETIIKEIN